jgi:hypothetical protein
MQVRFQLLKTEVAMVHQMGFLASAQGGAQYVSDDVETSTMIIALASIVTNQQAHLSSSHW